MNSRTLWAVVAAAALLFATIFIVSVAAVTAATVAVPFLKIAQKMNYFGLGEDEREQLKDLADQEINGVKIKDILFEELDCDKVPPQQATEGWCIEEEPIEEDKPIPPDKEWLVPIWKKAARKYNIPWQLLAAVHAARTNFGSVNCEPGYGDAGKGFGYYRPHQPAWEAYGDAGKEVGHGEVTGPEGGCYTAGPPVSPNRDEKSSAYDPIDSTYAMARQLAANGAGGQDDWDYDGDAPEGLPLPSEPYFPYRGSLFTGNLGKAPDKVKPLAGIPRNYLILYVVAGRQYKVPWYYLAAFGYNETQHGQSTLKGVRSGVNFAGCCSGPMQMNIKNTWRQPGWERLWQGGSSPGLAKDYNGDGRIDVWDPRDAVHGAGRRIAGDLQRYSGNFALALAAYNAGAGNVAKYGGVPPFKETQSYVTRGIRMAQEYREAARRNPGVLDRLIRALEEGAEQKRECKGRVPADPVSKAVAWMSPEESASACYVAIVHEWFEAIKAKPPGAKLQIGDFPPELRFLDATEVRLPPGEGYTMYVGCGYGTRGADVHRGRRDLIMLIQAVGKIWHERHPSAPFMVGDITSPNSCHVSHTRGVDVDIDYPTNAYRRNYRAADARDFLTMYIMGGASIIGFQPLDNGMGSSAMNAIVANWPNHTNHSHIRIDGSRGTYPGKVLRLSEDYDAGTAPGCDGGPTWESGAAHVAADGYSEAETRAAGERYAKSKGYCGPAYVTHEGDVTYRNGVPGVNIKYRTREGSSTEWTPLR